MNERAIRHEIVVNATPEQVWQAFTTVAGVKAFLCPDARIEARVGGAYEIYFLVDAPAGSRGSEGCTILELDPPRRLVFNWNFPPHLPAIRSEHTRVELTFTPAGWEGTRVSLLQSEWQAGPEWDAGFAYFESAWAEVLHWLRQYFDSEVPDSKRGQT